MSPRSRNLRAQRLGKIPGKTFFISARAGGNQYRCVRVPRHEGPSGARRGSESFFVFFVIDPPRGRPVGGGGTRRSSEGDTDILIISGRLFRKLSKILRSTCRLSFIEVQGFLQSRFK